MEQGKEDPAAGPFIANALFATLTNVHFDRARFRELIDQAFAIRDAIPASGRAEPDACTWKPVNEHDILEKLCYWIFRLAEDRRISSQVPVFS